MLSAYDRCMWFILFIEVQLCQLIAYQEPMKVN